MVISVSKTMFALVPLCLAVAILSLQLEDVQGITDPDLPSSVFYPFGQDEGDSVAPVNDDGSTGAVPISTGFPFFNRTYRQLFVSCVEIHVSVMINIISVHEGRSQKNI